MPCKDKYRPSRCYSSSKKSREEEKNTEEKAHHLLRFVGISPRAYTTAGGLPYGDQRRLEIARALATEPKLLLLDEPAAGMNQHETDGLKSLISKIRNNAISILLIEHHMKVVMSISDRVVGPGTMGKSWQKGHRKRYRTTLTS